MFPFSETIQNLNDIRTKVDGNFAEQNVKTMCIDMGSTKAQN